MDDLPMNLPILVYWKGNVEQSKKQKGHYNFFSIESELIIIKLPHDLNKFRNILITPYFIEDQQLILDSFAPIQVFQPEIFLAEVYLVETPLIKATLIHLAPIIHSCRQFKKYLE